jgi:Zn-finger nucleic acid-binding protein
MELFHRRRYFFCRHCGTFHFIPHDGPGNVVIDTCRRCDAVWLDSGELTQIVDAPGRDRRS